MLRYHGHRGRRLPRNSPEALDTARHDSTRNAARKAARATAPSRTSSWSRRAYLFSAQEHKGQVRHSGEPYLVHPLEVADFLADMKLDVVAICAGLLHDVVEDTLVTPERIAELFGDEMAHVVEGVTKLGAIPFSTSEERQAENLRKMLLAMVDDIRVILVKLADRLHNMRTLQHLPDDKRTKIAQETLDIYAPIANRLGMSKVKNELEELAFKALEPESYEALRAKVEAKRKHAESLIDDLAARLRAKLEEAQVPVIAVDGRIKRLFSIHRKLLRQKIDLAAGLRLHRAARHHRLGEGLLRRARHHPPDLVAGARPHQGLRGDAAAQRLPVAAHLGHQRAGRAVRGADSQRGDAPPRRGRDRGALEIQGRPRRRPARRALLPVAAAAARTPAGGARSAGVHAEPEDRPLSGGGLRLHAEGRGALAAARGDAGGLRLLRPHRRRPPVRGGAHQRQDGAAAHASCRTATSSRSTRSPATSPAATGCRSSSPRARAARSSTSCRPRSAPAASSSGGGCSRRRRGAST